MRPVFKRIDTCAAEFASPTAYMYSTYEAPFAGAPVTEARPSSREKIVILGGGPNRIGQGIEFDYCCCHASFALRAAGFETIMINCNPETVSTDYDTSDRLYFEPLTSRRRARNFGDVEKQAGKLRGAIVQFGGQTPLKLAHALEAGGDPILGTSVDSIDLAEDRDRFKRLLDKLGLKQPKNGIAYSVEQSRLVAAELGLPLVVRPSYVLGGRAMAIIHDAGGLRRLSARHPAGPRALRHQGALSQRQDGPDQHGARQESAALRSLSLRCRRDRRRCALRRQATSSSAASWNISKRPASIPATAPVHCRRVLCRRPCCAAIEEQTRKLALALNVGGLMNVQLALKDDEIYVLEVNPRASRTVPFVAKVIGMPIAKIAARIMAGESLASFGLKPMRADHVGVKEAVFPFARFPGVDTVLGPEMRSTGEVIGLDRSFAIAFAKSQLGGGTKVPVERHRFRFRS